MDERRVAEKPVVVSPGETTFIEIKLRGLGGVEGSVENQYTDALLKGVRVALIDGVGNAVAEDTTGDDGFYHFRRVRSGVYLVRVTLPRGYKSNDPAEKSVKVDTGTTARVDFTIHRQGTVRGRVMNELTGESLPKVEVHLLNSAGSVVRSMTTDDEGNYEFKDLEVDRYTIRVELPEEYEQVGEEVAAGG